MSTNIQGGIYIDASDYNAGRTSALASFTSMQSLGLVFCVARALEVGTSSAPTGYPDGTDEHWPQHKSFLKTLRSSSLVIGALCRLQRDGDAAGQADTFLGLIDGSHNPSGWLCVVQVQGNDGITAYSNPDYDTLSNFAKEFWSQAPGMPLFLWTSRTAWQANSLGKNANTLGTRLLSDVEGVDNCIGGGQLGTIDIRCFDNLSTYLSWGYTAKTPNSGDYAGYSGVYASAMLHPGNVKFGANVHSLLAFNGTSDQLISATIPNVIPEQRWIPGEIEMLYEVQVPTIFDPTTGPPINWAVTGTVGMKYAVQKPNFAEVTPQGTSILADAMPVSVLTDG